MTDTFRFHVKGRVTFRTAIDVDEWVEAKNKDEAAEKAYDRAHDKALHGDGDLDDDTDDLIVTVDPVQSEAFDRSNKWRWYFGTDDAGLIGRDGDRLWVGTGMIIVGVTEGEHAALFGPVKNANRRPTDGIGKAIAAMVSLSVESYDRSVPTNTFIHRLLSVLTYDAIRLQHVDRGTPRVVLMRGSECVAIVGGFRLDAVDTPSTVPLSVALADAEELRAVTP